MRTGIGYDIHRLIPTVEPNEIPIGGFSISCHFKIESHSDGDVLLHAIVDSLLGALALGDIGQWFPDTKPENKNRSSKEFVRIVMDKVRALGWRVNQIDSVVRLEQPQLAPFSDSIREQIATLLNVELVDVSVKVKRGEGLGPIGTRKAIAAHVVVTLRELEDRGRVH